MSKTALRETLLKIAQRRPQLRVALLTQVRKLAGTSDDLNAIQSFLESGLLLLKDLRANQQLVADLLAKGEARRLGRVTGIGVGRINNEGHRVSAQVRGTSGTYDVRITISPQRGHHCECLDWSKNGRQIGPCKHVLALAQAWKERMLDVELAELLQSTSQILKPYGG